MFTPTTPMQRADALASRQHGAIARRQAVGAGLTDDQVDYLVERRRWLTQVRGVYVVAGSADTWVRQAMVACLAGPPGTVASHLTALALMGRGDPPLVPHVTVPPRASGRFKLAVVHHSPVEPIDVWTVRSVPTTRPGRMLADCAALLPRSMVDSLVDELLCAGITDVAAVQSAVDRLARGPGRKGVPALMGALAPWHSGAAPGSPAEMRLYRRITERGYEAPVRQFKLETPDGMTVAIFDFAWPSHRYAWEYDGDLAHAPRRWRHDDERDDRIRAQGWAVDHIDRFDIRPGTNRIWRLLDERLGRPAAAS